MNLEYIQKDDFIRRSEQQIVAYKGMIRAFEALKPTIIAFNGKMLTRRLITAFNTNNVSNDYFPISLNGINIRVTIKEHLRRIPNGGFVSNPDYTLEVSVDKASWKINAEKTIENANIVINQLEKRIATLNECIENYDINVGKLQEIEVLLKEYRNTVPYEMSVSFCEYGTKCYIDKIF